MSRRLEADLADHVHSGCDAGHTRKIERWPTLVSRAVSPAPKPGCKAPRSMLRFVEAG